ncbi:N-acetyltransferase [Deinococcus cellulosilyticus NBRC 106333 = KACC 11606]|uniref:N-acetyltransferase n=2 Tax=Deinococcus cellulosilyticus TaxID=401558 RepID=A0A511N620_DEIC1|nr:N-acetyltransferase [Deinococcus cellulosilyticus NBRC 106333 = KACC 11606]
MFHQIHSDPEVVRFLFWEPRTLEENRAALERKMGDTLWEEGKAFSWAVVEQQSGTLLGEAVLICRSFQHQQAEVGYVFGTGSQGKGFAHEAIHAVLDYAFTHLPLHRIYARTDARNHGSRKLMERLGMRQEAHFIQSEIFKGEWGDEVHCAILRQEWHEKQAPGK